MKNTILFDLDGTLVDSSEGIINSLNYMIDRLGLKKLDQATLRLFIGPPLKDSLSTYLEVTDPLEIDQAIATYREHFAVAGLKELTMYPNIAETLTSLTKENRLAVATSKPEKYAKQIIKNLGLNQFEGVFGADMDGKLSSKTAVIEYALDQLNTTEGIMVGDREFDILGGRENHLKTIGVLYGFGDRTELTAAGADEIIESVTEIPFAVKKIK